MSRPRPMIQCVRCGEPMDYAEGATVCRQCIPIAIAAADLAALQWINDLTTGRVARGRLIAAARRIAVQRIGTDG